MNFHIIEKQAAPDIAELIANAPIIEMPEPIYSDFIKNQMANDKIFQMIKNAKCF